MTNDNPIILPAPPVQMGNPEVIKVLEHTLALARQGKVAGVAIGVAQGPGAISLSVAGNFPCELMAACMEIANRLRDGLFRKQSPLLMPGRPM